MMAVLLIFLNVESTIELKQKQIRERQKAEALAAGLEWTEPAVEETGRKLSVAAARKRDALWGKEQKQGEAYCAKIAAELGVMS